MADREKISKGLESKKKKGSQSLDAALFGIIAQEYGRLDKKKRTVDALYDTMMKKNLLDGLSKTDFSLYFEAIAKKGFSIKELTDPKMQKLNRHLGTDQSERQIINGALQGMQQSLKSHAGVFDGFVDEYGFTKEGSRVVLRETSKCRSVTELQDARVAYSKKKKVDEGADKGVSRFLSGLGIPGSSTDQTNKRVTQAAIRKIERNLPSSQLRAKREARAPLPLHAYSDVQNLFDLQDILSSFLHKYRGEFSDQERSSFQGLIVSNRNILDEVRQHTNRDEGVENEYSKWGGTFQHMFNTLVTAQTLENIEESKERVEEQVSGVATMTRGLVPSASKVAEIHSVGGLAEVEPSIHEDEIALKATQDQEEFERKEHALKRKKWNAYLRKIAKTDHKLAAILDAGSRPSGFDFTRLDQQDMTYYFQTQIKQQLAPLIKDGIHHMLGLNENELTHYLLNIYDMDTRELVIPTAEGDVALEFNFKGVQPGSTLTEDELSPSFFSTWGGGKCHVGLKVTPENEDFLRDVVSPLSYKDFNGTPVHEGEYVKLVGPGGKEVEGYLTLIEESFVETSGKKRQQVHHNNHNHRALTTTPVSTVAATRDLVNDPSDITKPWVISADDRDGQGNKKKSDEGDRKVTEKDYEKSNLWLTGDELSGLTTAYLLGQQSLSPSKLSQEDVKTLAEYEEKQKPEDTYTDTYENRGHKTSEGGTESVEEKESQYKEFMAAWRGLSGSSDRSESNDFGFQPGTKIYLEDDTAKGLPWSPGAMYCFEIENIDKTKGTWSVKMHGLKQGAGKFEGKSQSLSLSPESIADFKKFFTGNIGVVTEPTDGGIEDAYHVLHDAGVITKQPSSLAKAHRGSDGREDKSNSIKYPYYTDGKHVLSMKPGGGNNVAIESTRIDDFKDEKGKGAKQKLKYSKVVDYPTFRLMMQGKDWKPMDEDDYQLHMHDQKKEETQLTDIGTKRQVFSINNVIGAAKNVFSKIGDKMKEYDNEMTDEFMFRATQKGSLLRSVAGGFGALGMSSVQEGLEMAHMDIYGEKNKKTFAKINKWKEIFGQHDDKGEQMDDLVMPYLMSESKPAKRPYKAAGALLHMLDKAGGAYGRSMVKYAGTGFWVDLLLGPAAKKKFEEENNEIVRQLEKDPGNANLMQLYADKEMHFIHVLIDNQWDGLKHFYGVTYADTVAELKNKAFGEDSINGKYNIYMDSRDFDRVDFEFHGSIKKLAMDKTIGSLKAMVELADSDTERLKVQEAFAMAMLSGVFLNVTNYKTKEDIQKLAIRIGFMPGVWVKDFDQQQKVAGLFDFITDGKLGDEMGFHIDNHKGKNFGSGLSDMAKNGKFRGWWKSHGKDIMSFLELKNLKNNPEKSLITLSQDTTGEKVGPEGNIPDKYERGLLDEVMQNLTTERMSSFDTKAEAGAFTGAPFTIPSTVVQNKFARNQYGKFSTDSESMLRSTQAFWGALTDQTPKDKVTVEVFTFIFKKYTGFFSHLDNADSEGFFPKTLGIAKKLLREGGAKNVREAHSLIDVAIVRMGNMSHNLPPEMNGSLKAFKNMIIANMDHLDERVMADVYEGKDEKVWKFTKPGPYKIHSNYDRKTDREKYPYNGKLDALQRRLFNQGKTLFGDEYSGTGESMSQREVRKPSSVIIHNQEAKKKLEVAISDLLKGEDTGNKGGKKTDSGFDDGSDDQGVNEDEGIYERGFSL